MVVRGVIRHAREQERIVRGALGVAQSTDSRWG